jgi:DNA-binding Lrp family transcriptional regulator
MAERDLDEALLHELRRNARLSVSELARLLDISRSTVSDRLQRLERRGVIKGYTIVPGDALAERRVRAHVMVNTSAGQGNRLITALKRMPNIQRAYAVSGIYDLIVIAEADSTGELDAVLDALRELEGVEGTLTSVILSTKF